MEDFEDNGYALLDQENFSGYLANSPPIDYDLGLLNDATAISDSNQTHIGPSLSMPQDQPALDGFSDFCELNQIPTSPPMPDLTDSFEIDPSPDDFLDIANLISQSDIKKICKDLSNETNIGANEGKIDNGSDETIEVSKKKIHQINVTSQKIGKRSIDGRKKMYQEQRRLRRRSKRAHSHQRSSVYMGVIRHGERFEAFVDHDTDKRSKQTTVFLGMFEQEEAAARAHDLAALKLRGTPTPTNFPLTDYIKDLEEMQYMRNQEYIQAIKRKYSNSKYISYKKWQARLGKGKGKELEDGVYLGTYDTQEEAARPNDIASVRLKGGESVTNFGIHQYDLTKTHQIEELSAGRGASQWINRDTVEDALEKFDKDHESSSSLEPQLSLLKKLEALLIDDVPIDQQKFNENKQVQPQMPSSSSLVENPTPKSQINSTSFDGPPSVENALGTDNGYFDADFRTLAPDEFLNEEPTLEGLWEIFNTSKNSSSLSGIQEEERFEGLWEIFNTSKKSSSQSGIQKANESHPHHVQNVTNPVFHQNLNNNSLSHSYKSPSFLPEMSTEHKSDLQNNGGINVGYDEGSGSKMIWEGNSTNIEEIFTGVEERRCQGIEVLLGIQNQNVQSQQSVTSTNQYLQQNPRPYHNHGLQNPSSMFQQNVSGTNQYLQKNPIPYNTHGLHNPSSMFQQSVTGTNQYLQQNPSRYHIQGLQNPSSMFHRPYFPRGFNTNGSGMELNQKSANYAHTGHFSSNGITVAGHSTPMEIGGNNFFGGTHGNENGMKGSMG